MRQLSDPLTDDDKAWLRSWNKPIPGEDDDTAGATIDVGGENTPSTNWGTSDDTSGEPQEYEDMTKPQLRKLIEARNVSRADEDHLKVSGTKDDMIAVLNADDETQASTTSE